MPPCAICPAVEHPAVPCAEVATCTAGVYRRYLTETGGLRPAASFLLKLRAKNPDSLPLMLALGHCSLLNQSYGVALGEYFQAYRCVCVCWGCGGGESGRSGPRWSEKETGQAGRGLKARSGWECPFRFHCGLKRSPAACLHRRLPHRVRPQEPLVLLCIAAALVNQAATKYVPDRHRAVLQAFAFLNEYSEHRWGGCVVSGGESRWHFVCVRRREGRMGWRCSWRRCLTMRSRHHEPSLRACYNSGCCLPALPRNRRNPQEAAYNTARAAHHLGLLHIAVPYYERALEEGPPPSAAATAEGACAACAPGCECCPRVPRRTGSD